MTRLLPVPVLLLLLMLAGSSIAQEPPTVVSVRHILVCYNGCAARGAFTLTKEEALAKIQEICELIQDGEINFPMAAVEFSQCPSSSKGGNLGEFGRGQMVLPFENAAFSLPVGAMSGIVETRFGYHLIYREK